MILTNSKIHAGHLSRAMVILFFAAAILSSCVPMKKISYMQDEAGEEMEQTNFTNTNVPEYKVHAGDNLYIKVASLDEKSNYFENSSNYNNYYTESAIYLNSYTVNDSGIVEFPLIGKVKVDNMTISDIREEIQKKVNEYVKNTVVMVKLANFRVSMVGEFKQPGKYVVYQDKITIFEAIAMAGDMTDFAKKDRILLVRQTEGGSRTYRINLNSNKILESGLYYLMPNDLIYAQAVKGKQFAFKEFPYVLILTTITTTLLLLNYFETH